MTFAMGHGKEYKIGIFVLAVLLVSFFVINFLRGKDIFNREMTIVSSYNDVEGLVQSDPVYIKGYKAGSVTSVDYNTGTGMFDVSCSVLKKFRIPSDSKMTIYSRDIMGGKAVRIDLGSSSSDACDGDFLAPASQPDMISSLSSGIQPLISKITSTVDNLDSITASVNSLLGQENRDNISKAIADLESTMKEARRISSVIGGRSEELGLFIDNLASVSARLDTIAVKTDRSIDDIGQVTAALSRSDIDGLVSSFRTFLESLQDPDGTIGRLMSDDSMYESLDSFISGADSLLRKIQENPKKYVRISLF